MLDLGASINLMPFSVYKQLGLTELKPTTMSLLLADGSARYPRGIMEDVLVQVDKLVIPPDFVVLDMDDVSRETNMRPILLGRPFMKTARTIIDVHEGKLSMTVLDETVDFKVFKSDLQDINSVGCFAVDTLQSEDFPKNASEFFLSLIEDKGEKDVRQMDTCESQTLTEINELKSANTNLMMEVKTLRKERDEAIKKAEELARLVEEQEDDFAHKTGKIQRQAELKDQKINAMEEESCKTENALRIAKVKECDYLVELKKAESTIQFLTKVQEVKGVTFGRNIIKGESSHSNTKVSNIIFGPSFFPHNCYFCHTRGHKRAQCAEFIESCKNKQRKPRGKPRGLRQIWVRKDRLDQVSETITDGKNAPDMKECPKFLDTKGGSMSGKDA